MRRIRRGFLGIVFSLAGGTALTCGAVQESTSRDIESAAPFVPTPMQSVRAMLELAGVTGDDVVYDLGSGDGRIVVMAAEEFGARGVGIELRQELIDQSWERARQAGVEDRVDFRRQDIFETDVSEATIVTLYLLPDANLRLRPILMSQLEPGSRVVSHAFDMGDWEPDEVKQEEVRTFYLWVIPAQVAGTWRGEIDSSSQRRSFEFEFQQEFQEVTATLRSGERSFTVEDVELSGRSLRFLIRDSESELQGPVRFQGEVHGDVIEGRVQVGDAPVREAPVSIRRVTE